MSLSANYADVSALWLNDANDLRLLPALNRLKTFSLSLAPLFYFEKFFDINLGLFQDGAQSSFGHISGVIRDGRESFCRGVIPDFVAAGGLAVKLEAEAFQNFDDVAVSKT